MWPFQGKSEPIHSEEYEKILKRIVEIQADFAHSKAEISSLRTDLDNLRGIFNRKLAGIRKTDSEISDEKIANVYKNQVLIPDNGTLR